MPNINPFISSSDSSLAAADLDSLIMSPFPQRGFFRDLSHLQHYFETYCRLCPPPWAAPGLKLTTENIIQSELWLPLNSIRPIFYRLLRNVLSYPPIFSSTPFATSSCWFSIVSTFPAWLADYRNPADILHQLMFDKQFRQRFIFWLFMPQRYYGAGSNRYPEQMRLLTQWLTKWSAIEPLYCLDAVCGDGTALYAWHDTLLKSGHNLQHIHCEGWALDPLECWTAAYQPAGCHLLHTDSKPVVLPGNARLIFRAVDLLHLPPNFRQHFDLVFCNGLLGGPIIHTSEQMERVIEYLSKLLSPRGMIVVADHFHDGWRKIIPYETIQQYFHRSNLVTRPFGEGFCAQKKGTQQSGCPAFWLTHSD